MYLVQLHGFKDRENGPSIVVSDGTSNPSDWAKHVRFGLKTNFNTSLYGVDYWELGGTTNVQKHDVMIKGGNFLHLEINKTTRTMLEESSPSRVLISQALTNFA